MDINAPEFSSEVVTDIQGLHMADTKVDNSGEKRGAEDGALLLYTREHRLMVFLCSLLSWTHLYLPFPDWSEHCHTGISHHSCELSIDNNITVPTVQ